MIKLLEQKNNIQTLLGFGSNVSYIGFNFNDPLLKEIKFRKALSLAIDRQALIKYFLNDRSHPFLLYGSLQMAESWLIFTSSIFIG